MVDLAPTRLIDFLQSSTAATTPPLNNSTNLQTYTGSLGGALPPAVDDIGNGRFAVVGNSEFNDKGTALVRSW